MHFPQTDTLRMLSVSTRSLSGIVPRIVRRPVAQAFRPEGFHCNGRVSPKIGKASPPEGVSYRYPPCENRLSTSLAQGILVQPHDRRLPRRVVDGDDVEPHRAFLHMALPQKGVRGAYQHLVLFPTDAQVWYGNLPFRNRACPYLHQL